MGGLEAVDGVLGEVGVAGAGAAMPDHRERGVERRHVVARYSGLEVGSSGAVS